MSTALLQDTFLQPDPEFRRDTRFAVTAEGRAALAVDPRSDIDEDAAGTVPLQTLVRCPGCGGVESITLIIDETLLPAIPIRVAEFPTRCGERGVLFAAEDRIEMERGADATIARLAQFMLYPDVTTGRASVQKVLALSSVRRTLKEAFGDACVIPASSRPFRHREEDR